MYAGVVGSRAVVALLRRDRRRVLVGLRIDLRSSVRWRFRRSYPAFVSGIVNAGVSLGRLAMFAGQDVARFQIEIEGLQGHGAVVIQILLAHGK